MGDVWLATQMPFKLKKTNKKRMKEVLKSPTRSQTYLSMKRLHIVGCHYENGKAEDDFSMAVESKQKSTFR
jgi:hypothetical protein